MHRLVRSPEERTMALLQIDTAELLAKSQTVEATLGRIQSDVS
jgi:early secretory antigenic target protein ESAT-6